MAGIEPILARRRADARFEEDVWSFMDCVQGARLTHLTETELQGRLEALDRNIQYLDVDDGRDNLPPERGWISPWWWLRLRHWALLEFERRGLTARATSVLPSMPHVHPACRGVMTGGSKLLVRISRRDWILEALREGAVRLAPAAIYESMLNDAARGDEEMSKSYRRDGARVSITTSSGRPIIPLGEVRFSTRRAAERDDRLVDMPYWFCSYSSDLDPRLFTEFTCGDPAQDACLIIFDPLTFIERLLRPVIGAAPRTLKQLFPIEYFDPYYPPTDHLEVVRTKEMRFAYQREMRLMLDPEDGPPIADGPLTIRIGSIADIAAVYDADGALIEGNGPTSFLAHGAS